MGRVLGALGAVTVLLFGVGGSAGAEDGYRLWLRAEGGGADVTLPCDEPSETLTIARDELSAALPHGTVRFATSSCRGEGSPRLPRQRDVGEEGYRIAMDGEGYVITARSDVGALYGTYRLIRAVSTGEAMPEDGLTEQPAKRLRLLNHWDNLDRHVERGYSGESIWNWHLLPDYLDPRYTDYARANASIGINGVSLTNVNADATVLTPPFIEKVAALAGVFRPYGIKVYLTARFSAPIEIGGLETADPLDGEVAAWWKAKADEIYAAIPDFGGFLVKANSEGQPGPQDYGRTHADGANMLARAVEPHGGIVMWRAFVYSAEEPEDRVKQAYTEFVPLDGKFADNVLVQVKNGPLDFQPREPFSPLFGAMPKTPLLAELQITKEYLGFATHLSYLGPLWSEALTADTHARGKDSLVADRVDGLAGVANIGTDRNWSGSQFAQANWYAFGRLAWDPKAEPEAIARDWVRQTFTDDAEAVDRIVGMMMRSREAVVDYMTPLGLTHLMGTGHHYGPAPWVDDLGRADWTPYYYHRATKDAVGFDRTESGSDAVSQYHEPLASQWNEVETTPEELLLWFHRVPWDHEVKDGSTLWQSLVAHYDRGVAEVQAMRETWAGLEGKIDEDRYAQTADFLAIQEKEARWWRDASIAYWQSVNGLDLPEGARPPEHDLAWYKAQSFPYAPGN
ncbi:alpha-glucuronidase [Parvularcula dongshanensis]|uniref:Alpha-glucuronidase n=1 Tax=Parvularcula dongshanensis TaxID=1173995 RepID=A0A840I663_9PROT|nr:alpha-glucuronidase [Parvularcula dongshanensis]MBB4659902.1 alpha-glucuronidase [Parvularcula dongshanensis]